MTHLLLLAIVYLAFVSLGLPDGLLGVAWPAIRAQMDQPLAAVGYITVTMTICSAASSFCAGSITKRLGTGVVVAGSCLATGLALVGLSVAPSLAWLVLLGIPLGLGAGAVDASLNHYVAEHYSSRHMNWLHGFWGVGATTGPLVMGFALASSAGWAGGAKTLGMMQLGLAAVLALSLPLWKVQHPKPLTLGGESGLAAHRMPVRTAALWLSPLIFLLYVAAEVGTGLWAASILVSTRGLSTANAGLWVSAYYGAIMVGRFGVGLVAHHVNNRKLVQLGLCLATLGATAFALPGVFGTWASGGLVLLGLGCAPVFPSLMHETARRFPPDVARSVIGHQVSLAYVGGSIVPAAFGVLASWAGLGTVIPLVACLLVAVLFLTSALDRMT